MVAENGNGVTHHKAGRYKIGMWDNESARRWAQRRKFKPEQLSAFEDFLSFLETVFVNPADIHVRPPSPFYILVLEASGTQPADIISACNLLGGSVSFLLVRFMCLQGFV